MKEFKLGDISKIVSGSTAPKEELFNEKLGLPFIRAGHLEGLCNGEDINKLPKIEENTIKGMVKVPKNTIVFAKSGMSCMKARVYQTKEEAFIVNHLAGVICSDYIEPDYLKFYFQYNKPNRLVLDDSYPSIRLSDISNIKLIIPDRAKQIIISRVLDKCQEIIQKRKEQIEALDELVKSKFIEMFGEWFKNKTYYHQLSEICTFIDYRGKTPEKSESGIPLITAKNVKSNSFSFEPREYIPSENYREVMTRGIPKVNDILFTTEAPLGNVCRIPSIEGEFCVGQRLITMQPTDRIVSEYLEYALLSEQFQNEMWKHASGSTVKGIRSKELVKLSLPVPPIELQNQFSDFVNQVDKLKFEMEKSLKELEDNFNALMQKAFDGELFN